MMKAIFYTILCLFTLTGLIPFSSFTGIQCQLFAEPQINLTVDNEPLGEVLNKVFENTDYGFHLDEPWEQHPVTATLHGLPLEQSLRRLLRDLNHSIVWESNNFVTILIFGHPLSGVSDTTISYVSRVREAPEETAPELPVEDETGEEPESVDEHSEPSE
jgi:type II secretory pathway component GspD/PulD (secretin)